MNSSERSTPEKIQNEDVDLGTLFYKIGRSVSNFFRSLGRFLTRMGNSFLFLLLFLSRNLIWLIVGTALGLGYGLYLMKMRGISYYSEMTVKANFNSARSLYNTVDYLNALVSNGSDDELARTFNISTEEARSLNNFVTQPVETELIAADMYREKFGPAQRDDRLQVDTFWTHTILYRDFKRSLTKFDYPFHIVTAVSTNRALFSKLQNGIIGIVSNNEFLKQSRDKEAVSNKDEERLIGSALQSLDTLRQAYAQRLSKGQETSAPGAQLTVLNSNPVQKAVPELEVYDKMLDLVDELKKTRTRSVTDRNIVEVISPFSPVGQKTSFLQQSISRYALIGFCISLAILLGLYIYRALKAFEKRTRRSSISPAADQTPYAG